MTTNVGLDRDTLDLMLDSLDDFVAEDLPDERLLELDHEDICPEDTVRAMCGDALGVQLVFIPEEYGGHGRRRVRRLPRLRADGAHRPRARHRRCSPRSWAATRSSSAATAEQKQASGWAASPRRASCSPTAPPSPRRAATWAR